MTPRKRRPYIPPKRAILVYKSISIKKYRVTEYHHSLTDYLLIEVLRIRILPDLDYEKRLAFSGRIYKRTGKHEYTYMPSQRYNTFSRMVNIQRIRISRLSKERRKQGGLVAKIPH